MDSPSLASESNLDRGTHSKPVSTVRSVTVRFAGDSGDGMQLAGTQFSDVSAMAGNDISTLPDFPAEIRAPAGSVAGVSGYQIQFSSTDIFTPGDEVDALVAMNPASLRANLRNIKPGGLIIANGDAFNAVGLKKAGYTENPLEDGSLSNYRIVVVPIDKLNAEAVKESGITGKAIDRCKNFFALGLTYWLYDRPLQPTINYIEQKFGKKMPDVAKANIATLRAGFNFGETTELLPVQYHIDRAQLPSGTYRRITGNEAVALGLVAAARLAEKELFYGSYPITPASTILEALADLKQYDVVTFQAEDEIAAIGSSVGASFTGALGATGTSGPGLALKSETIGLAVMMELPLVIVNVQRGGPSTGLPTKTEQADLHQALYGRHGECPAPVIAAASPADCFQAALEAATVAMKYMTPVILLTDGYLANSAEPWLIPDIGKFEKIVINHPTQPNHDNGFMPYLRDENFVRPWAIPGTKGLEHRLGGIEKADLTGHISYDPANHEKMVHLRAAKVAGVKPVGAPYLWTGEKQGKLLVLGWGGTCGAIKAATLSLIEMGIAAAHCHLRYLNPLPDDLKQILSQFEHVLVPELNSGQLASVIRSTYLLEVKRLNKVRGLPFTVNDIVTAATAVLEGREVEEGIGADSDAAMDEDEG